MQNRFCLILIVFLQIFSSSCLAHHQLLTEQKRQIWIQHNSSTPPKLLAQIWDNQSGIPVAFREFEYDVDGKIISCTLYGNLSNNNDTPLLLDEEDHLIDNGVDREVTYWPEFDQEQESLNTSHKHINLEVIPLKAEENYEDTTESSLWDSCWSSLLSVIDFFQYIKDELSFDPYLSEYTDKAAHFLFNESFLQFYGYYKDISHTGTYHPGHEISDHVRITLINGILNIKDDMENSLKYFSETHGHATIHFVFHATGGWSDDVIHSSIVKAGYVSEIAHLLAETWKRLIEEMGGVNGPGTIIHYAHSIGATNTMMAGTLLTQQERSMINVVTIGSPSMIPDDAGFASVANYMSTRDGIGLMDPFGYLRGIFTDDSNVYFLDAPWDIPFTDHLLISPRYMNVIEMLGKQFIELYQKRLH